MRLAVGGPLLVVLAVGGCAQLSGLADLSVVDQRAIGDETDDGSEPRETTGPARDGGARAEGGPGTRLDGAPGDAGSDRTTPTPDAEPADPKGAAGVRCGGSLVCGSDTRCCWNPDNDLGRCVAPGTACGDNHVSYTCDDAFDCPGQVCCASVVVLMLGASCSNSCGNVQLCTETSECGGGKTCSAAGLGAPPSYEACR